MSVGEHSADLGRVDRDQVSRAWLARRRRVRDLNGTSDVSAELGEQRDDVIGGDSDLRGEIVECGAVGKEFGEEIAAERPCSSSGERLSLCCVRSEP